LNEQDNNNIDIDEDNNKERVVNSQTHDNKRKIERILFLIKLYMI